MSALLGPNLGYRDARAAIRFLVTAFGFEEVVAYEGEKKDTVGHAELRWPGGGFVMLHSADPDGNSIADLTARAASAGGYPACSVHIATSEPDALFARAVAAGATVVREVGDSPLGTRGFIARDPEGLYWSFGTALPSLVRDAHGRWRQSDEGFGLCRSPPIDRPSRAWPIDWSCRKELQFHQDYPDRPAATSMTQFAIRRQARVTR